MPPHHHQREQMQPQGIPQGGRQFAPKAQTFLSKTSSDVRALNTSILVISQKLKYIIRNEKILARNMLVLNKKIKALQEGGLPRNPDSEGGMGGGFSDMGRKLAENSELIISLQSELELVKETYAKAEDLKEMKYVIDSINPLEFVTVKDLNEALGKHAPQKKGK